MERPEPGTLWKKTASRAALAAPNLVTGAVSMAASAALANPLPLILWGLGAVSWVLYATTSEKQLNKTLEEDRRAAEARTEAEREALRVQVEQSLRLPPLAEWVRRGQLPDYAAQYRALAEMRQQIVRLSRGRQELSFVSDLGIDRQLSYMLSAYLQFVRARIAYLQILASTTPASSVAPPRIPESERVRSAGRHNVPVRRQPEDERLPDYQIPRLEERMGQLDRKIDELKELAEREPAGAEARRWHIDILEKQKDLLRETGERDQSVSAQLSAFPDAFGVILGRVSASQVDADEVSSYMGSIVERVEETERFVKAFAPAMDQMLTRVAQPAG